MKLNILSSSNSACKQYSALFVRQTTALFLAFVMLFTCCVPVSLAEEIVASETNLTVVTDGLSEDAIVVVTQSDGKQPSGNQTTEVSATPTPTPVTEVTPPPTSEETPTPVTEETPPQTTDAPLASAGEVTPPPATEEALPQTSEATPTPAAEETPQPTSEATPTPATEETPQPTSEATPTPATEETPQPTSEATPTPAAEETPQPTTGATPVETEEDEDATLVENDEETVMISVTIDGASSTYEQNTVIDLGTPSKDNYVFQGWILVSGEGSLNGTQFTVPTQGEVTIQSDWVGVEQTLTIYYTDMDGATLAQFDKYDTLYGETVTLESLDSNFTIPSISGYVPAVATQKGTSERVDLKVSNPTETFTSFVERIINPISRNEVFYVRYEVTPEPSLLAVMSSEPSPSVDTSPEPSPSVDTSPEPSPSVDTSPEPSPTPDTSPEPSPTPDTSPEPVIQISVTVDGTTTMYAPNTVVDLGTPSKENYIFEGWEILTGEGTLNGTQFIVPEQGEVVIQSKWVGIEQTLTIYYTDMGGRTLAHSDEYDTLYGETVTLISLDGDFALPVVNGYVPSVGLQLGSSESVDLNVSNPTEAFKSFAERVINPISKDEVLYVRYAPIQYGYTVKYFQENLNGTYSEVTADRFATTGTFGETIYSSDYINKTYEGFAFDHVSTESIVITEGTNEISVYYARRSYNLYYQVNESASAVLSKKYGASVGANEIPTPTRTGYVFKEWRITSATGSVFNRTTFKMPAHDVSLVATWNPGNATYTINYWIESLASAQAWTNAHHADGQDAAPTGWTFLNSISGRTAQVESTITKNMVTTAENLSAVGMDTVNYLYHSMTNVTVKPDGTTVVDVYYKAKVYQYHFVKSDGTTHYPFTTGGVNHPQGRLYTKYKTSNVSFWPYKNGDTTIVWKRDGTSIMTATTSFNYSYGDVMTLHYNTGNQISIVYALKQRVNGTYPDTTKANAYEYVKFAGFNTCNINMTESRLPVGFTYDSLNTASGWKTVNAGFNANEGKITYENNNNTAYVFIRLRRLLYSITINNGNTNVQTFNNIKFEEAISGKTINSFDPPAAFAGYQFTGFTETNTGTFFAGNTPAAAYGAYCNSVGNKMPAYNVVLRAEWKAPVYSANFYLDSGLTTHYTGENNIPKGNSVSISVGTPTKPGYSFAGWWYVENGVEKPYFITMPIVSNIKIYAKWELIESNVNVVVRHVLKDDSGNVTGTHSTETVQGYVGTTIALNAISIEGYWPEIVSVNYEIVEGANEYSFFYVPASQVQYTVRYVNAETGEQIADPTIAMSDLGQLSIVAHAKNIPGATPDYSSKVLELTSDPSKNVLTFRYTFRTQDLTSYTVEYYFEDANGSYVVDETKTATFSDIIQWKKIESTDVSMPSYEGYVLNSSNTTRFPVYVNPNGTTVIKVYYDRITYSVTYRYDTEVPEGATNTELPETRSYKWGSTVAFANTPTPPVAWNFVGWTIESPDGITISGEGTSFEMPMADVVIVGRFEQLDHYIEASWDYQNGVYEGGTFRWDCNKLEYVPNGDPTGWVALPYVRCTVTNRGSKSVNLSFDNETGYWEAYLSGSQQISSSTTLAGNGASYTFEFYTSGCSTVSGNATLLNWDADKLYAKANELAMHGNSQVPFTDNFKLTVSAAE